MTNDQAIKIIECLGWGYTDGEIREAVGIARDAIKERGRYEAAHEPVRVRADKVWNTFKCPNCGMTHGDDEHDVETLRYCPHCGRPLIWER